MKIKRLLKNLAGALEKDVLSTSLNYPIKFSHIMYSRACKYLQQFLCIHFSEKEHFLIFPEVSLYLPVDFNAGI